MKAQIPRKRFFLLSNENRQLLEAVDRLVKKGRRVNVLVSGDTGSGKSELVIQYAATRNRPLATLEIGRLGDPSQIFGYMELKDGQTSYVKGLFTEAITTPNCIIHLQEINRPENDKALNALFSVLDDTNRAIWIDELGDHLQVAPGVVIFATLNEGFEFIGTQPLDPALANRFHIKLRLQYLPPECERTILTQRSGVSFQIASDLVTLAQGLRDNDQHPLKVSTRDLLAIADLMAVGVPRLVAIKAALGANSDTVESVLLREHLMGDNEDKESSDGGYGTLDLVEPVARPIDGYPTLNLGPITQEQVPPKSTPDPNLDDLLPELDTP